MVIPVRSTPVEANIGRAPIDDQMIGRLVEAFYARVRSDTVLGPIFDARISDWDAHLTSMRRFWSSVMLTSGTYQGDPMRKHAPLPVSGAHFDRWLALFRQTAQDICPPETAGHFIDRAARIARSLEMGIAVARGTLLQSGERLPEPEPAA